MNPWVFGNSHAPVYERQNFINGASSTSAMPDSVGRNVLTHADENEDYNFSDEVLRYISQILMEEDVEDKDRMLQKSSELQVAEKSFYEAIGKKYPASPEQSFEEFPGYPLSVDAYRVHNLFGSDQFYQIPQSSTSWNSGNSEVDGWIESPESNPEVSDLCNESQSVSLFMKGFEEASKFIPNCDELVVSTEPCNKLKGKKHLHDHNNMFSDEQRSCKQAAVYSDTDVHSKIFDEVLLHHAGDRNKAVVSLRETLQSESAKKMHDTAQKKIVDFRTLLINCAQAVAVDDRRTANALLKHIRQHSSPFGDGNQRLAHCFANGLEARLFGTGSQICRDFISKRRSASDVLKAYLLYLAACPFKKLSNYFSNKTISKITRGAARIHIIDFGILHGFQWPTFIQCQSERVGGPPKIRITGIDYPQPGFRPSESVEETGRRLAHYAKEFRVPFEFNPVAKRWETVQVEDLKLEEDEVVIVNCIDRTKNLPDETMVVECSRNALLKMIRKINPAIFIHGVLNGAYNAPFFLTRFKEALFHFSSQFDMLETIVPRENEERLLLETEIFASEVFNIVACEGWERVERPETYKQWRARTLKAGFVPVPLDKEVEERAKLRIRAYHKDFVIAEDSPWLLLGWKGRITYALSSWKPR